MVISGSDDVLAFEISGQVSGQALVVDETIARFGNNIIGVTGTAIGDARATRTLTVDVMAAAITKAKPVLHRKG
jgi:hypothetical protein